MNIVARGAFYTRVIRRVSLALVNRQAVRVARTSHRSPISRADPARCAFQFQSYSDAGEPERTGATGTEKKREIRSGGATNREDHARRRARKEKRHRDTDKIWSDRSN